MITSPYSKHAKLFPNKAALITKDGVLTYREWDKAVRKTATWFQAMDSHHKTVGIHLPNGIPFLQVFAGAAAAGWKAVPLDLKWKKEELQKRIELAQPDFIITTTNLFSKEIGFNQNVLIWKECKEKIAEMPTKKNFPDLDDSLPFYLGFTSGSTGSPKAFIRSHLSWIESFVCTRREFGIKENDHVLIPGPLFHSHSLFGAMSTLFIGGTVYVLDKFSPEKMFSVIRDHPVSVVYIVPTMAEALLKKNTSVRQPLKLISSGAKLEVHTRNRIRSMFPNLILFEFYGAGELSFVSFSNNERKPDSVGRPFHNVKVQIRRHNGEIAGVGEIGKIYVRSPMTFIGYITEPGGYAKSIADEQGWVTVNDMGWIDEEGYLYVAGRENNMILYGGINLFPEEIEAVLTKHPEVEKAAVVGLSDPYWGQIAVGIIQGDVSKLELKRYCKKHLASYKVPRKWCFIEEIPMTTSGKIARGELLRLVEKRLVNATSINDRKHPMIERMSCCGKGM